MCGKDFKIANNKQKCCGGCIDTYTKQRKSKWYFDKKKGD